MLVSIGRTLAPKDCSCFQLLLGIHKAGVLRDVVDDCCKRGELGKCPAHLFICCPTCRTYGQVKADDVWLPVNVPVAAFASQEINPPTLPATGLLPDAGAADAMDGPQIWLFVMLMLELVPIANPQPQ